MNTVTNTNTNTSAPREREKLYRQMEELPYDLSSLDPSKLFLFLSTETKNGVMCFKYLAEFLNVFNTVVFFYVCNYIHHVKFLSYHSLSSSMKYNVFLFITMDSSFMITAFLYYFITRNKQVSRSNVKEIFIFALIGIVISQYLSGFVLSPKDIKSVREYIKLNYLVFSVIFFLAYDYTSNSHTTSSTAAKFGYSILAFVMSHMGFLIHLKLRVFLYAINFFEFIPEIRKLISNYSSRLNVMAYAGTLIWIIVFFIYVKEFYSLGVLLIFNLAFALLYPLLFNYFYRKDKRPILGLWDIPQVISYY